MKVIHSFFLLSSCFVERISDLVDKESKCVSFFDLYLLPDNNCYPTSSNLHSISKLSCTFLFKLAADEIGVPFLWWDTTIPICVLSLTSESHTFATAVAHMVWTHLKHTSDQIISVALWGNSLNCAGSVIWCRMLSRRGPCWLHFCWLLHTGSVIAFEAFLGACKNTLILVVGEPREEQRGAQHPNHLEIKHCKPFGESFDSCSDEMSKGAIVPVFNKG